MIPPLGVFLRGYAWFTQANGLDRTCDEARVAEALAEAAELSADHPEDEPAALLFALTKRARALTSGWDFVEISAQNLARVVLKAEILIDDRIELDELRLRVAAKIASFDDVRLWVAAISICRRAPRGTTRSSIASAPALPKPMPISRRRARNSI